MIVYCDNVSVIRASRGCSIGQDQSDYLEYSAKDLETTRTVSSVDRKQIGNDKILFR